MKTKDNSEAGKNINILDRACQSAGKIVDELSINTALKDRMWIDISKRLESINKKVLSWLLISATSISILVASTVLISSDKLDSIDTTENVKVSLNKVNLLNENTSKNLFEESVITWIEHKEITVNTQPLKYIRAIQIPSYPKKEVKHLPKIEPIRATLSHPIETSITMGGSSLNILPEVGLDYKIYQKVKENKIINIYLGLSAAINHNALLTSNEQPVNHINRLNYFSNVTLKLEDTLEGSVWNGKIGYLLNKNKNSIFKKNTLKLSIQRNINKRVRIGPELIMTNNFKNYYPGFGITVES